MFRFDNILGIVCVGKLNDDVCFLRDSKDNPRSFNSEKSALVISGDLQMDAFLAWCQAEGHLQQLGKEVQLAVLEFFPKAEGEKALIVISSGPLSALYCALKKMGIEPEYRYTYQGYRSGKEHGYAWGSWVFPPGFVTRFARVDLLWKPPIIASQKIIADQMSFNKDGNSQVESTREFASAARFLEKNPSSGPSVRNAGFQLLKEIRTHVNWDDSRRLWYATGACQGKKICAEDEKSQEKRDQFEPWIVATIVYPYDDLATACEYWLQAIDATENGLELRGSVAKYQTFNALTENVRLLHEKRADSIEEKFEQLEEGFRNWHARQNDEPGAPKAQVAKDDEDTSKTMKPME